MNRTVDQVDQVDRVDQVDQVDRPFWKTFSGKRELWIRWIGLDRAVFFALSFVSHCKNKHLQIWIRWITLPYIELPWKDDFRMYFSQPLSIGKTPIHPLQPLQP